MKPIYATQIMMGVGFLGELLLSRRHYWIMIFLTMFVIVSIFNSFIEIKRLLKEVQIR